MTRNQLVLLTKVIEQVKEGEKPLISNNNKVDLDSMGTYFNNLTLDVEKQIKRAKVRVGGTIAYRLLIEI